MTRLPVLIIAVVLTATPRESGACRWFGTQLECNVGGSRVVIGTQAAAGRSYARSFPAHSFRAEDGFPVDHPPLRQPFAIELQDVGADPGLCRKIGNETYCH